MKHYRTETVPQKRARKARLRRSQSWMPAFAASKLRPSTHRSLNSDVNFLRSLVMLFNPRRTP